ALVLQVVVPARLVGAALGLVLEGLLGVDAEEAQRRIQPLNPDGVAVDDRVLGGERGLADDEPRRLEGGGLLLPRAAPFPARRRERLRSRRTSEGEHGGGPDHRPHGGFLSWGVPEWPTPEVSLHQCVASSLVVALGSLVPSSARVPVVGRFR